MTIVRPRPSVPDRRENRGGAPNGAIAKFLTHRPLHERDDTDTLLVLFHLCGNRTTNAITLAPLLQKSPEEALQTLRRLSTGGDGLLEVTRHTAQRAAPAFRLRADALNALGGAVRYQRRTGEDIDRKVVAHVNEYG